MRFFVIFVFLALTGIAQPLEQETKRNGVIGSWAVKITLLNSAEKNLIFNAHQGGDGAFQLLDTGPDDKPVANPQPAAWSVANGRLSISSEVELPIGNCCREQGALILKAKLPSTGASMSGNVIFITNVDEEESPYKYRATAGTFTATRLSDK